MSETVGVKTARQVFTHEGVVMLEVCTTLLLPQIPLWEKVCQVSNQRQNAIIEKAKQVILPGLIREYENSQNQRKKFSFPRLVLFSTLTSVEIYGEVFSALWQFRLKRAGEILSSQAFSLCLSPENKHIQKPV